MNREDTIKRRIFDNNDIKIVIEKQDIILDDNTYKISFLKDGFKYIMLRSSVDMEKDIYTEDIYNYPTTRYSILTTFEDNKESHDEKKFNKFLVDYIIRHNIDTVTGFNPNTERREVILEIPKVKSTSEMIIRLDLNQTSPS